MRPKPSYRSRSFARPLSPPSPSCCHHPNNIVSLPRRIIVPVLLLLSFSSSFFMIGALDETEPIQDQQQQAQAKELKKLKNRHPISSYRKGNKRINSDTGAPLAIFDINYKLEDIETNNEGDLSKSSTTTTLEDAKAKVDHYLSVEGYNLFYNQEEQQQEPIDDDQSSEISTNYFRGTNNRESSSTDAGIVTSADTFLETIEFISYHKFTPTWSVLRYKQVFPFHDPNGFLNAAQFNLDSSSSSSTRTNNDTKYIPVYMGEIAVTINEETSTIVMMTCNYFKDIALKEEDFLLQLHSKYKHDIMVADAIEESKRNTLLKEIYTIHKNNENKGGDPSLLKSPQDIMQIISSTSPSSSTVDSANTNKDNINQSFRHYDSQIMLHKNRLVYKVDVTHKNSYEHRELLVDAFNGVIISNIDKTLDKLGGIEEVKKHSGEKEETKKPKTVVSAKTRRRSLFGGVDKNIKNKLELKNAAKLVSSGAGTGTIDVDALSAIKDKLIAKQEEKEDDDVVREDTKTDHILGDLPQQIQDGSIILSSMSQELLEEQQQQQEDDDTDDSTIDISANVSKTTDAKTNKVDVQAFTFLPDPTSKSKLNYGTLGLIDNNDADSATLTNNRNQISLDVTQSGNLYILTNDNVQIVDVEAPFRGTFSQSSSDFRVTRNNNLFEATSVFYHVDAYMTYVKTELGVSVTPRQYTGGVKADPSASNGDDNSYYDTQDGTLHFGEGGVDDAEDSDVIIHELGHALHDWLTDGQLSQINGLSEGFGDYLAMSYSRSFNLFNQDDQKYDWVFKWDGHNEFWDGRITNYNQNYPGGLIGQIHTDGQIWSTCSMNVHGVIGRTKSDKSQLLGIAALNSISNQEDAANAVVQAASNLNYGDTVVNQMTDGYDACGYDVVLATCGNGIKEGGEECDGNQLGGATCTSIGCQTGVPSCTNDCKLSYSGCGISSSIGYLFRLEFIFDDYPQETTWDLRQINGNIITSFNGLYSPTQTLANHYRCLRTSMDCHILNLYDSAGDGMCCDFGTGRFKIFRDNSLLQNCQGRFLTGHSVEICQGTTASEITCPNESDICADDEFEFTFQFYPDSFPAETSWNLVRDSDGVVVEAESSYSLINLYRYSFCLPRECHTLNLFDTNGFCCEEGQGYYTFSIDEVSAPSSCTQAKFETEKSHAICPGDIEGACTDECGDNIVGATEQCDGENLAGAVCGDVGCGAGTPTCTSSCQLDYSTCSVGSDQFSFEFNITTDNYPGETTWELQTSDGVVVDTGGPYTLDGTQFLYAYCLNSTIGCYNLTLRDSRNDGICCTYGSGTYTYADRDFSCPNPQFGSSISHSICSDGKDITCPGVAECLETEFEFKVEIVPDGYPEENEWTLRNSNNVQVASGGPFAKGDTGQVISFSSCFMKTEPCMTFEITDTYADGMCCNYGQGSYKLFVDDVLLPDANPRFGSNITHKVCPDGSGGGGGSGSATCGNGIKEEGEDCDDRDFGDATCESYTGCTQGSLTCTENCRLNHAECSLGNNQVEFFMRYKTDRSASETTWEIVNFEDDVIFSQPFVYEDETTYGIRRCLNTNEDCHRIIFYDEGGDGITNGTQGKITIYSDDVSQTNGYCPDTNFGSRVGYEIGQAGQCCPRTQWESFVNFITFGLIS